MTNTVCCGTCKYFEVRDETIRPPFYTCALNQIMQDTDNLKLKFVKKRSIDWTDCCHRWESK